MIRLKGRSLVFLRSAFAGCQEGSVSSLRSGHLQFIRGQSSSSNNGCEQQLFVHSSGVKRGFGTGTSNWRIHSRNMSSSGDIPNRISILIKENDVIVFSKSTCSFCAKVKGLFKDLGINFLALEIDSFGSEMSLWQDALAAKTGQRTVPNVFIKGRHIGGSDDTFKFHKENKLLPLVKGQNSSSSSSGGSGGKYDYDLIVIGGGSGGLAASKAAGKLGKRVAVCDFVEPTPYGTSWGLGGTCVNVGCIPKKLMHQSALIGQSLRDAPSFGWKVKDSTPFHWSTLVENVQNYIKSLNWGYRVALKDADVTYLNEYARFINPHTIETTNRKGKKRQLTAEKFIIATGGRPRYPDIPGSEHTVSSDDIFSLPHHPGKVLCIGASYIALECAGFLAGVGIETSVMVRSILLRGFDQQIAQMIGDHMGDHRVKFIKGWVPTEIIKIGKGSPPKFLVKAKETRGSKTFEMEVNTVLVAIGRDPCTSLDLDKAGVKTSKSGKILVTESEQTTTPHIFAIGDVAEGRPELTPVAIHAGQLLVKRLYEGSMVLAEYDKVPTTVFTPLEYGCVGLSEEDAIDKFGGDDVEVYHSHFQPLEATVPKRDENKGYVKLICVKSQDERIVGFHYLGPNAGEITQGFALGVKMGATKTDFDFTIGIHPTTAETFTMLNITKASGATAIRTGC